jgi:hypothetical protein
MGFLEPNVIPGLDKAILELLLVVCAVVGSALLITVVSVAGLIRAVRRRRRGGHSRPAVALAFIALAITVLWLGYWIAVDIHNRAHPISALLAINVTLCVFPLMWLVAALNANGAQRQ